MTPASTDLLIVAFYSIIKLILELSLKSLQTLQMSEYAGLEITKGPSHRFNIE